MKIASIKDIIHRAGLTIYFTGSRAYGIPEEKDDNPQYAECARDYDFYASFDDQEKVLALLEIVASRISHPVAKNSLGHDCFICEDGVIDIFFVSRDEIETIILITGFIQSLVRRPAHSPLRSSMIEDKLERCHVFETVRTLLRHVRLSGEQRAVKS